MWRIDRDENDYTDAELIAWDIVLPQKHIPILADDEDDAYRISKYLSRHFSKPVLKKVVEKLELRNWKGGL